MIVYINTHRPLLYTIAFEERPRGQQMSHIYDKYDINGIYDKMPHDLLSKDNSKLG